MGFFDKKEYETTVKNCYTRLDVEKIQKNNHQVDTLETELKVMQTVLQDGFFGAKGNCIKKLGKNENGPKGYTYKIRLNTYDGRAYGREEKQEEKTLIIFDHYEAKAHEKSSRHGPN